MNKCKSYLLRGRSSGTGMTAQSGDYWRGHPLRLWVSETGQRASHSTSEVVHLH